MHSNTIEPFSNGVTEVMMSPNNKLRTLMKYRYYCGLTPAKLKKR
jgi:hypothetical protein